MRLIPIRWQVLILVSIIFILAAGCASEPIISTLKADKTILVTGTHASIECITSTSEDNLNYEWSSNGGTIKGEGKFAEWLAPASTGDYIITAKVNGDHGRKGTASITITVRENHAPAIQYFVLSPQNPKYFNGDEILKKQNCDIECVAQDEDSDELAYTWSCNKGDISGTGAKITWTAPSEKCNAYVTVEISDGNGGMATDYVTFQVLTCACAFREPSTSS